MTFRLHHSVTLRCSIETAWDLLSSPDQLARLQEVLPTLNTFILTSSGDANAASSTPSLPDKEELLAILASDEFPKDAGLPWPDIDGGPEAPHFTFYESALAFVEGTQVSVPSHHAVLFHSRVARAGIEEWKLRVLEDLDDGQVRVTETVWGTASLLLWCYLRVTGIATKVHKEHMELYHTLVKDQST
ncbi:hypothetical protein BX600DRAFT_468595 [Xylariales sp. PMI_506]|nr:hypothetical protein BX600DRAFT_468595 [Xylariales sp. PMI_506]